MDLKMYQNVLDDFQIVLNKKYLAFQVSFKYFDIDIHKVFAHFKGDRGERYWFKSKSNDTNVVGVKRLNSIIQSKFSSEQLQKEKSKIYNDIQLVQLDEGYESKLRLFGGMKFDEKETTDEWNQFNQVGFHLYQWNFDFEHKELIYVLPVEDVSVNTLLDDIIKVFREIERTVYTTPTSPKLTMMRDLYTEDWKSLVSNTVKQLDDSFLKVVLSRQRLLIFDDLIDPSYFIQQLDDTSNTYTLYFEKGDSTFISKTPELLFKIAKGTVTTNAIAGSVPHGLNEAENEKNKQFLLNDDKNLIEHDFVKQSIVDDLMKLSERVTSQHTPSILETQFLYHLYTAIRAEIKADTTEFEVLCKLHPTPAVGGLPKQRAAEYIKSEEYGVRGLYAAPLGVITEGTESEFCVAIRSMLVNGDSVSLFAGCGIVKESNAEAEFNETAIKLKPMLNVLGVNED